MRLDHTWKNQHFTEQGLGLCVGTRLCVCGYTVMQHCKVTYLHIELVLHASSHCNPVHLAAEGMRFAFPLRSV